MKPKTDSMEETKNMTKETEYTCNQCGKELLHVSYPNSTEIWVCTNPECPNFALLQIPAELLVKKKK